MDRTLVAAARSGDEDAFGLLARGSADRLFAVAHRILHDVDRAEDAVQQALLTAWRELPGLRDLDRFEAWLHKLLVHACYAESRRGRRWDASVMPLPLDGPPTPDDTQGVVVRDALERGFRRLPAEQRAVLVLHHYLDWSLPEIALTLGLPLGTVKSRLRSGTAGLRAALEADARPLVHARPSA